MCLNLEFVYIFYIYNNPKLDIGFKTSGINISSLWFVRIENSLKTQKYENHLNDILGCLFNQFLHELNDIELFLQYSRLKN